MTREKQNIQPTETSSLNLVVVLQKHTWFTFSLAIRFSDPNTPRVPELPVWTTSCTANWATSLTVSSHSLHPACFGPISKDFIINARNSVHKWVCVVMIPAVMLQQLYCSSVVSRTVLWYRSTDQNRSLITHNNSKTLFHLFSPPHCPSRLCLSFSS